MKTIRQEFADTMVEVGLKDPKLVVLVGDISHGILQKFNTACQDRYYNIGICEPSIVGMSAGLYKSGLIPVVHTIAPFLIERSYEQIKLDFGYQKCGVNLVSVGGAFDYSQLGCSHHCYADISLMKHFKRANIFFSASCMEFNILFKQAYNNGLINYFRIADNAHDVEFKKEDIIVGKGIRVTEGNDFTIVVIGYQLKPALEAGKYLLNKNISVEVLYFPTIKPFDKDLVIESISKTKNVLVVEEASKSDGIYNYVLDATKEINDVNYQHIAIDDFIHEYDTYENLCRKNGFSSENFVDVILKTLKTKVLETIGQ